MESERESFLFVFGFLPFYPPFPFVVFPPLFRSRSLSSTCRVRIRACLSIIPPINYSHDPKERERERERGREKKRQKEREKTKTCKSKKEKISGSKAGSEGEHKESGSHPCPLSAPFSRNHTIKKRESKRETKRGSS